MLHLAYTRYRVLRRLGQGGAGRFPRPLRAAWWPRQPVPASREQWGRDLELLAEYQARILQAAGSVPEARLRVRRPGQPRPLAWELLGVALHDTYHGGQIRLLQRLMAKAR